MTGNKLWLLSISTSCINVHCQRLHFKHRWKNLTKCTVKTVVQHKNFSLGFNLCICPLCILSCKNRKCNCYMQDTLLTQMLNKLFMLAVKVYRIKVYRIRKIHKFQQSWPFNVQNNLPSDFLTFSRIVRFFSSRRAFLARFSSGKTEISFTNSVTN